MEQKENQKIANIKIAGKIEIPPVILAPMSGVTDLPFRKLVKKFGSGLVVSEMIASRAMIIQTRESLQKCARNKDDYPMSVQLAGCDPEVMAEAARLNEDLGADIIDINYGCPVKKVVGGNAGSALMKDEDLAVKILEAVVKAVKIPVTVKMRMGWDSNHLNAPSLAKKAEDVGVQMITVHGRTRCQLYNGTANWDFIKQVKDVVKIPVIANGDIRNFDNINDALARSGADGIMIGRATYGKPWLISQAIEYIKARNENKLDDSNAMLKTKEPNNEEKLEIILSHFEDMIELYGMQTGVSMARKHFGWYSSGMKNSAEFRAKTMRMNEIEEIKDSLKEFFSLASREKEENKSVVYS